MLVWSESRTHDLPRHSPVHNQVSQVSHRCNYFKFLIRIGTSSETEITAQAGGAREVELIENFTGIQRSGSKATAAGRSTSSTIYVEQ